MVVNGHHMPDSFLGFIKGLAGIWVLKQDVDAYGNPLDTDFDTLPRVEHMTRMTERLAQHFGEVSPDEYQSWAEERAQDPGFIPYITDFSEIVWFGRNGSGASFCFDFRGNPHEPSVIHWEDSGSYWRRVAPDFDHFIALFRPLE